MTTQKLKFTNYVCLILSVFSCSTGAKKTEIASATAEVAQNDQDPVEYEEVRQTSNLGDLFKLEAERISNSKKKGLKRDDSFIYLPLKSGEKKYPVGISSASVSELRPPCVDDTEACYTYVGYYLKERFFLLERFVDEQSSFLMVGQKDGSERFIKSVPLFSPNRSFAITWTFEDMGNEDGFILLDFRKGFPPKRVEIDDSLIKENWHSGYVENVRWNSENDFVFELFRYLDGNTRREDGFLVLLPKLNVVTVKENGVWKMKAN